MGFTDLFKHKNHKNSKLKEMKWTSQNEMLIPEIRWYELCFVLFFVSIGVIMLAATIWRGFDVQITIAVATVLYMIFTALMFLAMLQANRAAKRPLICLEVKEYPNKLGLFLIIKNVGRVPAKLYCGFKVIATYGRAKLLEGHLLPQGFDDYYDLLPEENLPFDLSSDLRVLVDGEYELLIEGTIYSEACATHNLRKKFIFERKEGLTHILAPKPVLVIPSDAQIHMEIEQKLKK